MTTRRAILSMEGFLRESVVVRPGIVAGDHSGA
jgi:hypothetical protein